MALADFFSCMSILYLIHQFGPYKQYLRQNDLLASRQQTASSSASKGSTAPHLQSIGTLY